jgi:dienelactone hydrolase
MVDVGKLKSLAEWPKARQAIEKSVVSILGAVPKKRAELQVKSADESLFLNYTRRRINYFISDWERVSAWLFVPDTREEVPGILCCHQAVPQGKDETAAIAGDSNLAFAQHFAEMGYVTLAPDCITAGERAPHKGEPYDTSAYYKENPKVSVMGKMLADHCHGLDVLCDTRQVDDERLGVVGHGLGGTNALLLAAFDERTRVAVASCPFTRFHEDTRPERWVDDGGFAALPKLKEAVEKKEFPFDWEHILALGAPNPTLILSALNDEKLANAKSAEKAVKLARNVYKFLGEEDALCIETHREGHRMTPALQDQADDWFERWL